MNLAAKITNNEIKKLDSLIESSPEYEKFQEEIELYLHKAGAPENRLAVLEFLLEAKISELRQELQHLSNQVSRLKNIL